MAERIVKEFGDDTFRIMEEEPERLAEIKGISLTKAMDIAAQLVDKRDMRKAMMFYRTMASAWELRVKFIPDTDRKYIQLLSRILTDLQTILTASDLKRLMKLRQRPALKWIRISESAVGFVCADTGGRTGTHLSAVDRIRAGVTALLLIDIRDMERHIMDMAIDKKLLSVKMHLAKSAFMLRCIIIWRLLLPSI